MSNITTALIAIIIAMGIGIGYTATRITTIKHKLDTVTQIAAQQKTDIDAMKVQRERAAALDRKVTKELADAKSENDRLRNDIASGAKRLYINARCSKLSKTATAARNSDATCARLTDAAERDYIRLRERISTATTMITGLQTYIRTQCQ